MHDHRVFTYRIDAEDLITYVNPEWLTFATENGAPDLDERRVVGKPLWPFIAGAELLDLYRLVVKKVRSDSAVICFSYRCDAPQLRRYMEIVLRPWGLCGVEFNSRCARLETRPAVPLLMPTAARSDQLVRMCSWCNRIATPEWLEVEEAIRQLRLFEKHPLPQITHGICDDCLKQALTKI